MTDFSQLRGKVALITGGSRGIGAAAAKRFASEGALVGLCARSEDQLNAVAEEILSTGGQAIVLPCDVGNFADVEAAVRKVVERFGQIDFLINNAGVIDPIARIADSDPAAWTRAIDINVNGVYHGLRAALPLMVAQGHGVVVNISSGAATNALEGWSHYCASKAAVLSLTRCAHKEYHDQGIRVVGLSPGTVATDMQVSIRDSGINPVSQMDASAHIEPAVAAKAILWLCTDDAADLSGEDFSIKTEEGRQRVGI